MSVSLRTSSLKPLKTETNKTYALIICIMAANNVMKADGKRTQWSFEGELHHYQWVQVHVDVVIISASGSTEKGREWEMYSTKTRTIPQWRIRQPPQTFVPAFSWGWPHCLLRDCSTAGKSTLLAGLPASRYSMCEIPDRICRRKSLHPGKPMFYSTYTKRKIKPIGGQTDSTKMDRVVAKTMPTRQRPHTPELRKWIQMPESPLSNRWANPFLETAWTYQVSDPRKFNLESHIHKELLSKHRAWGKSAEILLAREVEGLPHPQSSIFRVSAYSMSERYCIVWVCESTVNFGT